MGLPRKAVKGFGRCSAEKVVLTGKYTNFVTVALLKIKNLLINKKYLFLLACYFSAPYPCLMKKTLLLTATLLVSACNANQAPAPVSHQGNKVFDKNGATKVASYNQQSYKKYGNDNVSYIDSNEDLSPASVKSRPLAPVQYGNNAPVTSKYDEKVRVSSATFNNRPKPVIDDTRSQQYASTSNEYSAYTPRPKPAYDRPVRPERQAEIARVESNVEIPRAPKPIVEKQKSGEYLDLSKVQTFGSDASSNSKLSEVRPLKKPEYNKIETAAGNIPAPAPKPVSRSAMKSTEIAKKAITEREVKVASISPMAVERTITKTKVSTTNGAKFIKPLEGEIISGFGDKSDGTFNDGINILASEGTPVKAASAGAVVYSGNQLQGYGNLVIVRHTDGYLTAYAHLKNLEMQKGAAVQQGQVIGHVGKTGNVDKPQLHFGVRKGREPVNPKDFL